MPRVRKKTRFLPQVRQNCPPLLSCVHHAQITESLQKTKTNAPQMYGPKI